MKVELGISTMSDVVSNYGCPQTSEGLCGIMYRAA